MFKSVKTEVVWDIIKKKGERVAYVLPPLYETEDPYVQSYFHQTLQAIFTKNPKYVVLYINEYVSMEAIDIHKYEALFQVEIQWLTDLAHLTEDEFMEYHTPYKTYLYQHNLELPSHTDLFDIVINDNLNVTIPNQKSGKMIIEELVNQSFYLNKIISKLEQPLAGMHQSMDNDYDIAFLLGEEIPDPEILQPIITEYIKRSQCSAIYSINSDLYQHLRSFKKTRFPMHIVKTVKENTLLNMLKKLSMKYTTLVVLGKWNFQTKELLDYLVAQEKHTLFDPYAIATIIPDKQKSSFRLTTQPNALLQKYLDSSA